MSGNRSAERLTTESDNLETPCVVAAEAMFAGLVKDVTTGCSGKPLHLVERLIWARVLEVARLLVGGFVEAQTRSVAKSIRRAGAEIPFHCMKPVVYFSMFGRIEIRRPYYWSGSTGGFSPLDYELNLPGRCYSYFLQEVATLFGARGAYDKVTDTLEKLFGVTLWKQGAELIVGDSGAEVQRFYEQCRPPAPETEGELLVVGADGKGVPMRKPEKVQKTLRRTSGVRRNKKQMSIVTVVYTVDRRVRTPEQVTASLFSEGPVDRRLDPVVPQNKRVRALLGEAHDAFDELERHVQERRPDLKRERVLLIDGEKRMVEKAALPQFDGWTKILDVVHAIQRIWDAGVALLGEGNAQDWVKARVLRLLRGEVSGLIQEFEATAAKSRGTRRKIFRTVARYYRANAERMHYAEYLARGLPISTGVVEGACCTLVKQRMEGPGMRWTQAGAQAVLEVRALDQNGDWERFWRWFPAQERLRLYGRPRKDVA